MKILTSEKYIDKYILAQELNLTDEQLASVKMWIVNGLSAEKAIEEVLGRAIADHQKKKIKDKILTKQVAPKIPLKNYWG